MIDDKKDAQETNTFADATVKEGKWWITAAKMLPTIALSAITILHFCDLHSERDLVFNTVVMIFFIFCVIWWFWAVRKIIDTVKFLNRTHHTFSEIKEELQNIKTSFKNNDSNR